MPEKNKPPKSQTVSPHSTNKATTSRDKIFNYDRGKVTTTGPIPPKKK